MCLPKTRTCYPAVVVNRFFIGTYQIHRILCWDNSASCDRPRPSSADVTSSSENQRPPAPLFWQTVSARQLRKMVSTIMNLRKITNCKPSCIFVDVFRVFSRWWAYDDYFANKTYSCWLMRWKTGSRLGTRKPLNIFSLANICWITVFRLTHPPILRKYLYLLAFTFFVWWQACRVHVYFVLILTPVPFDFSKTIRMIPPRYWPSFSLIVWTTSL